ncbi:MAG: hypothetical protein IT256_00770 [Chitinophagaceae bacterium]|nr:hypothetical protein [Chitinophagaceae bacterium]
MTKTTQFIGLLLVSALLYSCSSKKLNSSYGDNKSYADEDSVERIKPKEKNAKMPFDTTSLPVLPKR